MTRAGAEGRALRRIQRPPDQRRCSQETLRLINNLKQEGQLPPELALEAAAHPMPKLAMGALPSTGMGLAEQPHWAQATGADWGRSTAG